jgi:TonB-dependent starch-binding outer membrane protein SusC
MIKKFTVKHVFLIGGLLMSFGAFADKIRGRVVDEKGEAVIGATVTIEKTKFGTVTDALGVYEIKELTPGTYKVRISYIGYVANVTDMATVADDVTATPVSKLVEDQQALDDVVVVGYGTKLKREMTGAVAKINAKELNDMPIPSFESALQAKLPGVQVTTGSGIAGSAAVIRIRGVASISAGGDPLYVVDGIPITQEYFLNNGSSSGNGGAMNNNPLASINPDDIESIDVLKDAAATAIYGSRGSNGVVLITTKRARKGGLRVSYNGSIGISKPTALPNMLNSEQYLQLYQEAYENDGGIGLAKLPNGISWEDARKTNTNWVDETTRTGIKNNQNFSISNGGKKGGIMANFGYSNNESFLVGNRYERISSRVNGDYSITPKLKATISTSLSQGNNYRVNTAWSGGLGNAMSTALPIFPIYNSSGNYFTGGDNPVRVQELKKWRTREIRTINNIGLDYTIAKDLIATGRYNLDYMDLTDDQYDPQALTGQSNLGTAARSNTYVTNYSYYFMLNYHKTYSKVHNMALMGAYEFQESRTKTNNSNSTNAINGFWDKNAEVRGDSAFSHSYFSQNPSSYAFLSYFGRANYNYKQRYFLELVLRNDWSTKFGRNYRYGFFPAVSVSWVISDEKFFRLPAVSLAKLRMSYGKSGNANIPNYRYESNWSPTSAGTTYAGQPATYPNTLSNPNLRWETSWTFNTGLDVGLFKDRITLTAEYYNKRTTDVLMELTLPPSTGFSTYWDNVGAITNQGVEFNITSRNIVGKDFTWTTNFNIARNWNTITSIGPYSEDAVSGGTNDTRVVVGRSVGTNYLVRFKGVDPETGKPVYLDKNGNETFIWDPNDRVAVGDIQPDAVGGLGNQFRYKNWELSFLFNFVLGGDIYESSAKRQNGVITNWNMRTDLYDRWQKPGDVSAYPRLTLNTETYGASTPWINTTQWIQDGTFARLRNVTVAYNLPKTVCQKIKMNGIRFALTGTNLLTFTRYTGLDPEIARDFENATDRNMSPNITYLTAPQEKTYTFQVSVNF